MQYGFIRTATATPFIKVADCAHNSRQIAEIMREADTQGCELLVLPELCVTGATCGDLFRQKALLLAAEAALADLAEESRALNVITVVGAPVMAGGRLFNCAVVIGGGEILGAVPQISPSDRCFVSPRRGDAGEKAMIGGRAVSLGTRLLFRHAANSDFTFAAEVGGDLFMAVPPSCSHALAGALMVVNPSADNELAGRAEYRRQLVSQQSARLQCAYLCAGAGDGESTTDLVFSGHSLIVENGRVLAETRLFDNKMIVTDVDTMLLAGERAESDIFSDDYRVILFAQESRVQPLVRLVDRAPFMPRGEKAQKQRCDDILTMQAAGLVQRLRHTRLKRVVLALSGGLDSTLALLAAIRAFERLGYDRADILTLSLPCFGTTERTKNNAQKLAEAAGVTFMEINIKAAVLQHFKDIGHAPDVCDLVYENAQARERTQVAMDMAAERNGLMLGTGDLSELALGFTTYNGDHMSMYNVNTSIPKTLVRHIIRAVAEDGPDDLCAVLTDILNTPVSPELLPPDPGTGQVSQETEAIVGPYELHDFFLYYALRYGFPPEKIMFLAEAAFAPDYDRETIKKWLRLFYRRFFSGQFKRSCSPDGPKVGSVCLSPRGGWRMPSDAAAEAWMHRLN